MHLAHFRQFESLSFRISPEIGIPLFRVLCLLDFGLFVNQRRKLPPISIGVAAAQIDFRVIVSFDWDQGNKRKSADKHGVSQSEAEQLFFNDHTL